MHGMYISVQRSMHAHLSSLTSSSGDRKLHRPKAMGLKVTWKRHSACQSLNTGGASNNSNKPFDDDETTSVSPNDAPTVHAWKRAKSLLSTNVLPLALISGLTIGCLWPEVGAAAAETQLQTIVVIAIFIVSGLQLKQRDALQALQATGSVAYGGLRGPGGLIICCDGDSL